MLVDGVCVATTDIQKTPTLLGSMITYVIEVAFGPESPAPGSPNIFTVTDTLLPVNGDSFIAFGPITVNGVTADPLPAIA